MKHVTIKDIAVRLNLSVSTISRALADDKNIRFETRARIVKTAEEMGYRRNPVAALLRTGRTNSIGIIVNEMITSFAAKVIEGIQSVLHTKGYRIHIADSHDDPMQERRNLQMMESSLVDGLIVAPCNNSSNIDEFRRLAAKGLPMVFFSRSIKDLDVSKVVANDYDKAFYLTEHLLRSGRKRIVHVCGPDDVNNFADIRRGYTDCLRKFKVELSPDLIIPADLCVSDGQRVADQLVEDGVDFDAVFACTDILAISIMNALRRHGYSIPDDIAVAGFSGSPLAQLVYPLLTTVEPPHFEMGEKTARLLLDRIAAPSADLQTIVLDSRICLRESTYPAGT